MTKLLKAAVEELQQLTGEEQDRVATRLLEDLHARPREEKREGLYEPFAVLQEANLDLPPDYSDTYEEHLYGIEKAGDA